MVAVVQLKTFFSRKLTQDAATPASALAGSLVIEMARIDESSERSKALSTNAVLGCRPIAIWHACWGRGKAGGFGCADTCHAQWANHNNNTITLCCVIVRSVSTAVRLMRPEP